MEIGSISTSDYAAQLYSAKAKQESFQASLESAMQDKDKEELKTACQEFESYFLHMMFKQMRKSIGSDENSLIPKGNAESIFEDLLDEQYADQIAKGQGIGLADQMYKQMMKDFENYVKVAED